jgi:hypothetical protein
MRIRLMRRLALRLSLAATTAALLSCGVSARQELGTGSPDAGPGAAADAGPASGDGPAPADGGAPPSSGAPAHVTIAFDRHGGRGDHLDDVALEGAKVLLFLGAAPAQPEDGAPCVPAGAIVRDVSFAFALDLHGEGQTVAVRVDLDAGTVGEVRILVRAADVIEQGHHRSAQGQLTCRDADGTQLIVLRLVPAEPIELEPGADEELVAQFDDMGEIEEEACQADDHGGGGGGGDHDGGEHGGDHGGGDDHGDDACEDDGGTSSRVLVGDSFPLTRTR